MTIHGLSLKERFDLYVSPEPNTGCWLWMGFGVQNGYGRFAINSQPIAAHRAAYEFENGPIPAKMHVLHKCDVRCCVNPEHLFLGDNAINVADKVAKGRQAKGIKFGHSKLSDADVIKIRSSDKSTRNLAKEFGVGKSNVHSIISGKTWRHLK